MLGLLCLLILFIISFILIYITSDEFLDKQEEKMINKIFKERINE